MSKLKSIALHQQLMAEQEAEHRNLMEFFACELEKQKSLLAELKEMREARNSRMNAMLDSLTVHVSDTVAGMRENDASMFDQMMIAANTKIDALSQRLDELSGDDADETPLLTGPAGAVDEQLTSAEDAE